MMIEMVEIGGMRFKVLFGGTHIKKNPNNRRPLTPIVFITGWRL